ncbi:MAG: hypothetical protein HY343_01935 [Lentisphaerae bacterium]|nr:hypothetical protein [Lentisphaerota bacterium]
MRMFPSRSGFLSHLALMGLALLCLAGCEEDDFDHQPPAGQGSLIVDNNTYDDIRIYLNGYDTNSVSDYSRRTFDLAPGVYRVVLDQRSGDRTYRDDVDVLVGELTILDVRIGSLQSDEYDVTIRFD